MTDEPTAIEPIPTQPVPAASGLLDLRKALTVLDDQREAMVLRGDTEALCWGSAQLAAVIGDLNALQRQTRSDIAELVKAEWGDARGKPKRDIEGLGRVEVPSGRERKNWRSVELLREVVWGAAVDDETGQLRHDNPVDLIDAIIEAVAATMPVSGSTSWKVGTEDKGDPGTWTGLRGQGIDPDDWCDVEEKPSLAVVPKLP